jgi:hypothetical protein
MNIDEFLAIKEADRASLLASAESIAGLDGSDVLLAVGSLAEGIGTVKSDIDLILVTPRAVSFDPPEMVSWVVGKCIVDCRVLPSAFIDELLARLAAWSQLPWDVTKAANFSYEQLLLLHRLSSGVLLAPGVCADATVSIRPPRRQIARLKLHAARHMARTKQVDMAGFKDARDYRSLAFAAQELLGNAVDGLLAVFLQTNPTPKWRSRLLETLPADWESRLVLRPTGLSASEAFWRLHHLPEEADERSSLDYACRIATFARAVFWWAECELIGEFHQEEPNRWPATGRQAGDPGLPHLALDVDFRLSAAGIAVARLNELGEPLRLGLEDFLLMLLFDGATTVREAELFINDLSGNGAERNRVDSLISRIGERGAGLTVERNGLVASV